MVVDLHGNGFAAAWIITSSETTEVLARALKAFKEALLQARPEEHAHVAAFEPSCVITDCCQAEINALR